MLQGYLKVSRTIFEKSTLPEGLFLKKSGSKEICPQESVKKIVLSLRVGAKKHTFSDEEISLISSPLRKILFLLERTSFLDGIIEDLLKNKGFIELTFF